MRGFYVLENGNGHIWLSLKGSKPPKRPPEIEGQWTPVVETSIAKTGTNHGTQPWLEPLNQWKRWLQKIKYLWTIASQFCSGRTWCFLRQFLLAAQSQFHLKLLGRPVAAIKSKGITKPADEAPPESFGRCFSRNGWLTWIWNQAVRKCRGRNCEDVWSFFLSNEKWGFRVWIWCQSWSKD